MRFKTVSSIFTVLAAMFISCVGVADEPAMAQGPIAGTFNYLQKEPMTLFDAGMKSLRRLALDAAVKMAAKPDADPTSSVTYKAAEGIIEIAFSLKVKTDDSLEGLRAQCIEIRRQSILNMLRIGLTGFATQLSVKERIQRRIGGQFSHEPQGSMKQTAALGEQLSKITYFAVTLTTKAEPPITITCRGLANDAMTQAGR